MTKYHLDFVIAKLFQIPGKSQEVESSNEPLGWVILIPFDCVAVIIRELVVEVMIAFPKSNKS